MPTVIDVHVHLCRTPEQVDMVAGTLAPGLVNCLVVGLSWARAFAVGRGIPFMAVDHLEAHIHSCLMAPPGETAEPDVVELPMVALLVSGGHTAIYRYDGPGQVARLIERFSSRFSPRASPEAP